jgi:hypothetical protein
LGAEGLHEEGGSVVLLFPAYATCLRYKRRRRERKEKGERVQKEGKNETKIKPRNSMR